jgi:hypothetical protein
MRANPTLWQTFVALLRSVAVVEQTLFRATVLRDAALDCMTMLRLPCMTMLRLPLMAISVINAIPTT